MRRESAKGRASGTPALTPPQRCQRGGQTRRQSVEGQEFKDKGMVNSEGKKKKTNEAGKMSVDLNVLEVASVVWQGVEE